MDRKVFIRNGLLGTGIFVATNAVGSLIRNDIDELKKLEILEEDNIVGFNHLPNTTSKIMANTVLHKAETRGHANHG